MLMPPSLHADGPRHCMQVEKQAILTREREVLPAHVYAAAPEPRTLFASPIQFGYAAHTGPVYGLAYSPFHRNVILTAATDSSLRLYNQLQPAPFYITEPSSVPLLAAQWSPARPCVFAVGAADGSLFIYDLKRSKAKPEVTLKVWPATSRAVTCSLVFHPHGLPSAPLLACR